VEAADEIAQTVIWGASEPTCPAAMPRSPTGTIRFLTLEELTQLFAAAGASLRDRALFLIAYRHGLRASDVERWPF
jgi:integrase